MIRGLYTSGWSMLALNKKMDVLANNLANSSTNGYKRDTVAMEGFPALLAKRLHDYTDGIATGTSGSSPSAMMWVRCIRTFNREA